MQIRLSDHFTYRRLIRFALPSVAMMVMTSIYTIVDGFFVSNFAGKNAFAAVNLIYPVLMAVSAVGFMIGSGGSALVSFHLGEGQPEKASRVFSMLMELIVAVGAVVSVACYVCMPQIVDLLGASASIRADAILYGRVLILGEIPFMLQCSLQSFLAVAERTGLGLAISIAAGVMNAVGDLVLVYVLKLGIAGAAFASLASQLVGGLLPAVYFLRTRTGPVRFVPSRLELRPILRSCSNGASEMLTNLSTSVVSVLYNLRLMEAAQEDGIAAFGVIMYVSFIFMAVFFGFTIPYGPIVGYHYGAQHPGELQSLLRKGIGITAATAVLMTLLSELFAGPIAACYVGYDAALCEMTRVGFMLYSLSYLLCGFNILASAFFTGLGNGLVSGTISFLRTLVIQVLAIELLPLLFGLNGIWCAIDVAEAVTLVVTVLLTLRNAHRYGYLGASSSERPGDDLPQK